MLSTTTTNNVYNLENQRHTAAPLRKYLIIHWQSGRGLVDELGVDEPGHNRLAPIKITCEIVCVYT